MGSGKSTVAAQLAARGAVVLESDKYAREALGPGQPAVAELAELLGD
jgi:dephospho-CoA kinase